MGRRDVLVTLADEKFLDYAKQVFSSAYQHGGWKGDYLLLAYDIPEGNLSWFTERGILIHHCEPLEIENIRPEMRVRCAKYNLFTKEFKKWRKILFLDADTIVRGSLKPILKARGVAAVPDFWEIPLTTQFGHLKTVDENVNKKVFRRLKRDFNMERIAFNTGVMLINSDAIRDDIFPRLIEYSKRYGLISHYGDQGIINLVLKFQRLPIVFNLCPKFVCNSAWIEPGKLECIILHFILTKNVDEDKILMNEWRKNLNKADSINLQKRKKGKEWSRKRIMKVSNNYTRRMGSFPLMRYRLYYRYHKKVPIGTIREKTVELEKRLFFIKHLFPFVDWRDSLKLLLFFDSMIGKVGILVKSLCPKIYSKIKKDNSLLNQGLYDALDAYDGTL